MNKPEYQHIISNAIFAYAYHEIIIGTNGKPCDYRFLEVNKAFEEILGLPAAEIIGKTVTDLQPGIVDSAFDWIGYYGNIALNGGTETFEQFSEPLGSWFRVQVTCPQKGFFATTFNDVSNEYFIAEAAGELHGFNSRNIDYQKITDRMRTISGARYAVLNRFSSDGKTLQTVAVSGLKEMIDLASKMFGFSLTTRSWAYDPVRENRIKDLKTTFFENLPDLIGNVLPAAMVNIMTKLAGIGGVVVVKTETDGHMLGDFTLVFKKGRQMINKPLVESYADMIGMLLCRIEADHALRSTQLNYENFFNTIDDFLFVLNEQGQIINMNKTVIDRLGYSREELVGQSVLMIHPDDQLEEAMQIITDMLAGKVHMCPVPIVTKKGRMIPVETRITHGTWDGQPVLFGVTKDVSQLKLSEEKFSKVFKVNPSACGLSDLQTGEYVEVNDAFTALLGFEIPEVIGKTALELGILTPEMMSSVLERGRDKGNQYNLEAELHAKNGEVKNVLLSAETICLQDRVFKYTVVHDVTERKQVERQLFAAKEKAEESDRLKSAFLANMSHEIRTPMNGILGFTELLKEPLLSGEEQRKYIEVIERSGERLLNIINDIIDLSKLESGQTDIRLINCDVNEQLDFLESFFKPQAAEKGLRLSVISKLPADQSVICTDREKTYAVLTNLVKNAIKFTNQGSIEIGCRRTDGKVEFMVRDTGVGIPPEQVEIIFDRFRQGSLSLTREYEGAGLGLAISKGYVEMLGGTIGVVSEVGKGSEFRFTVPG